jgi:hypothetical protein
MARWRVTAKHYVLAKQFGEETTWVREETNRDTGRAFRRTFTVPLYIDPEDPICINKNTGYCVVATEGSEMPGDITLLSPCTPDMEPLDDDARKITATETPKWKDPINSLPISIGDDFGNQLLAMLTSQFNTVANNPSVSLKGASGDQIAKLEAMLLAQQEQIAKLLAGNGQVSVEEPLPEIDSELPLAPPSTAMAAAGRRA